MRKLIPILIFLTACSSYRYVHPEKSDADFKKDHRICSLVAEEQLTACYESRHCYKYSRVSYYKECMKDRFGWERLKN